MFTQTLILNSQYKPYNILDWKDAVTKMFSGSIEVLVQYDEVIGRIDRQTLSTFPKLKRALRQVIGSDVESLEIKVPAVAVIRRKLSNYKTGVKFSKTNVYTRDNFCCQYCGAKLPQTKLNYDHVIPRSQGGQTVWDNIVASCYTCNGKKANKTPDEANMPLLSVPTRPMVLPIAAGIFHYDRAKAPDEWMPFLDAVSAA